MFKPTDRLYKENGKKNNSASRNASVELIEVKFINY